MLAPDVIVIADIDFPRKRQRRSSRNMHGINHCREHLIPESVIFVVTVLSVVCRIDIEDQKVRILLAFLETFSQTEPMIRVPSECVFGLFENAVPKVVVALEFIADT